MQTATQAPERARRRRIRRRPVRTAPTLRPILQPVGARPVDGSLPDTAPRKRGKWRRHLVFVAVLGTLVGAWAFTLRPQSIGGPAGYVMVRGTSMLGTYNPGTLVIVHEQAAYSKGDIVAYHVPDGEIGAGITVIHRIIGGSAATGFITQGDNNPDPDDWRPKPSDIEGTAWVAIPKLGNILAFLHAPVPMAALAASIAIVIVLDPGRKRPEQQRKHPRKRGRARADTQ
jgi:signal peptidase I